MLYPTALLVTAVLIVLGLGIYQRLNVEVERQSDRKDKTDQGKSKWGRSESLRYVSAAARVS